MVSRRDIRRLGNDEGFTLIELLLAMTISLIVLFAVLGTFDNFSSDAARQTRVTDGNDQVRNTMDRVVSDLRQAATIEVAGANDLVYTVTDSTTQTRRERLCLDTSTRLWRASVKTATPPTTPIAAGTACPTSGSGAFRIANLLSANSTTNPAFRYDSTAPANVRSVGLTFALNTGSAGRPGSSTLRASTFVRAKGETALPVTGGDISTVCGTSGPLLTLSASVGSLAVTYTDINGNTLASGSAGSAVQLPAASNSTTVVVNISSAAGAVSQLVKTLAC